MRGTWGTRASGLGHPRGEDGASDAFHRLKFSALLRRRIEGQLVVLLVGAADGQIIDQQRRSQHRCRHIAYRPD